jgi:uncharacterized lipoprotein YehR (DUF1307 family)
MIMNSIFKNILVAAVLALVFVGCGSKEPDIYVKDINIANYKAALEGVSGKAGEHIKAALTAIETKDIKTAVTSLIDAASTKALTNEQMEAIMNVYGAISSYLASQPELRTQEIIGLEQKFTQVWNANFKG